MKEDNLQCNLAMQYVDSDRGSGPNQRPFGR